MFSPVFFHLVASAIRVFSMHALGGVLTQDMLQN
jgi:hypothetical protein